MLSLMNVDNFNDIITLKPWHNKLKMELDKEKSYKV
jgi:hypothetical protein